MMPPDTTSLHLLVFDFDWFIRTPVRAYVRVHIEGPRVLFVDSGANPNRVQKKRHATNQHAPRSNEHYFAVLLFFFWSVQDDFHALTAVLL